MDWYAMVILGSLGAFLVGYLGLVLCHRWFPLRAQLWLCRTLGWHDGEGRTEFDGASIHARCSICGVEVMMDSQGNWFQAHADARKGEER